ncbi:type III secretion system gatekeeper subunit SctW [Pseudomonas chlororaphis]|uniref:Invasion protein n=1 Tax=Pseudomonas chlororaphis TaxID=587753 RepID=A0AAX3FRJ5_9PSED|nr:type III secretion system gatekeeper subunit SctW [Pseudomonas chlororaphis]AZC38208.1 Type III secretion outermembrane contact sensing protein (YopN,Yop4b,LcrE) [Pseudomonas chlororaphis subsp. piscium]AZC44755.1 Type III secretion outermembrane contact sensing protein (YopN,Yop4b,LcrE) [Pseudomonas chlororaphis subsp. piscium]WDG70363.1 type III secretion system gatekeeper subunit SctW [Pseudomonas chlororaphis]WDH31851.1 type III secretion system gatekeeper subunit SctW [Pseudomonas chlor
MAAIGGVPSRTQMLRAQQGNEPQAKAAEVPDDDATPAASVQRFVENSDEMAASLRSQFRRRGDFGSKFEGLAESFERVLDEDVIPKARQIQSLAKLAERSIEWLLAQARGLFPDDSDLVLVLRELLRAKVMAEATRQRLETLLQQVLVQSPPKRLKAGINSALKAKMFGKALALRATLMRDTYRSFLESEGGAAESYEDWVAIYGYQHRGSVLEFIEAALLTDIDAQDPSCSREEFGQLLKKLSDLKRLRSVDVVFIRRLLRDELVCRHNASEPDWLVFLLGLLQFPDELEQLLSGVLGERLLLVEHHQRAQLLQLLRLTCLALPLELFGDDEALQRVAGQFTHLADLVFAHETIELHATLASRFTS